VQEHRQTRRGITTQHAANSDGDVHVPPGLPQPVNELLSLLVDRLLIEIAATSGSKIERAQHELHINRG
jgi:hypothetical protein